jgi:hypothetical protein
VAVGRGKRLKAGRRAVDRGERPRYRVHLDERVVPDMPWLEFDGARPPEIAEAARRAIAAELKVRPDQVEVEPIPEPSWPGADPTPEAVPRRSSGGDEATSG